MKLLNGSDLAGYIKQRQATDVRRLRTVRIFPKLAIVQTKDDPVIDTYVRLKKQYGSDIAVDVDVHRVNQPDSQSVIRSLNEDNKVHGIIVQLPLADQSQTDEIINSVVSKKDVDGLGSNANFEEATPMAIMWLLGGYNIDLLGKSILIIGHGKLVGAPLEKLLRQANIDVTVADKGTDNIKSLTKKADIIIAAASQPGILTPDMIKDGAVVVDAGVASEDGKTLGNVVPEVYDRDDLTITPQKGGVGPLTVCALFENVIRAAQQYGSKS